MVQIGMYLVVLYPSLGSARFGSFLARAFGQKARLGSARSISQKARFEKIRKNELPLTSSNQLCIIFVNDSNWLFQ